MRSHTRTESSLAASETADEWPRTGRVLPWLIAAFTVMLWLVPIDATTLPVHLPFDSTIDRFFLGALVVTWLVSLGANPSAIAWHRSRLNWAILVFVLIAVVSVMLNVTGLGRQEELSLALKKLSLLACYAGFFLIVATSLRPGEVRRFLVLMIGLAALMALGTVVEYRVHVDYFYRWAQHLPFVQVSPQPPDPPYGRPTVVGPTQHGLAAATVMAMMLPFAIVSLLESTTRRQKWLYALAVGLLLAGGVATLRKTSIVVPIVAVAVLFAYRPRPMLRLLPLGAVMVIFMQVVSPGALSGIRYQLEGGSKDSTEGRTSDYAAIRPDVLTHPLTGRGYGTYDPKIQVEKLQVTERHRYLDNELLLLLIETGIVGILCYLMVAGTAVSILHRVARSSDGIRAGPALATIAAIAAFVVSNVLFDTLSFSQVPYLYFCLLGFGVVLIASAEPTGLRATRLRQSPPATLSMANTPG